MVAILIRGIQHVWQVILRDFCCDDPSVAYFYMHVRKKKGPCTLNVFLANAGSLNLSDPSPTAKGIKRVPYFRLEKTRWKENLNRKLLCPKATPRSVRKTSCRLTQSQLRLCPRQIFRISLRSQQQRQHPGRAGKTWAASSPHP